MYVHRIDGVIVAVFARPVDGYADEFVELENPELIGLYKV